MTHKELMLKYFREVKNNISVQESNKELMINDPRGTIRDLRNDGYRIEDIVIHTTNRFGGACSYKQYYLIQDDIDMVNFEIEKKHIQSKK